MGRDVEMDAKQIARLMLEEMKNKKYIQNGMIVDCFRTVCEKNQLPHDSRLEEETFHLVKAALHGLKEPSV